MIFYFHNSIAVNEAFLSVEEMRTFLNDPVDQLRVLQPMHKIPVHQGGALGVQPWLRMKAGGQVRSPR
tara:strand:- start:1080 stop:1283 length:204 start_codon:yes stop_codon:yes gene_type:complete